MELTGFKLRLLSSHHRMLVQIEEGLGPIRQEGLMGRNYYVAPAFYVVDPDAETWGYFFTTGGTGLAYKQVNGAKCVYCSVGPMDGAVVRDIARWAGVHVYIDSDDVSYFSRSFIGIHTWKAGVRRLELPTQGPLYEVMTDTSYAAAETQVLDLAAKSTALYFRGSKQQWQELLAQAKV